MYITRQTLSNENIKQGFISLRVLLISKNAIFNKLDKFLCFIFHGGRKMCAFVPIYYSVTHGNYFWVTSGAWKVSMYDLTLSMNRNK